MTQTPTLPYYAVIFTSTLNDNADGYDQMAEKMLALAEQQPGFLGMESVRQEIGVTVSYWQDLDAIIAWKKNSEHLVAQRQGRQQWYSEYRVRIAKVEREYNFG